MNKSAPEGMFRALSISFFLRVISRGISVLKNALTAALFGLSPIVDYFSISNGIAIFFFAFQESFEFFSTKEIKAAHDRGETSRALYQELGLSFALSTLILIILLVFLGPLLTIFGAGLTEDQRLVVRGHVLWMLPGAYLTLPAAAISVVMRSSRRFSRSFATDIFISGSIILSLWGLRRNDHALVISYSVGQAIGFAFLVKQVWPWLKEYHSPFAALGREFRAFLSRIRPLLPIIVFDQLYVASEKYCGTNMGEGFLASLTYASLLPVLVISLPAFSNIFSVQVGEQDKEKKFNDFLSAIGLYALPITAFVFFFSPEILKFLIGYGKLAQESLEPVSRILRILSFSFFFSLTQQIYGRIFFIEHRWADYLVPMVLGRVLAIAAIFAFLRTDYSYVGIAVFYIATPLITSAGGFWRGKRLGYRVYHSTLRFLAKLSFASFLIAWVLSQVFDGKLLEMLLAGIIFCGALGLVVLLGMREEFSDRLRERVTRLLKLN